MKTEENIVNKGFFDWLDKHFEWRKYFKNEFLSSYTFRHESDKDYLGYSGTVAAVLLIVQFLTGILLLFYYKSTPELAFASVETIRSNVPNGRLFINIHSIGSMLIIFVIFVHMIRIMLISAYRGPREPQWYTGTALFFVLLFSGFSGYLLPWSQQSFWACVIGTESLRALPLVGDIIVTLLRGGENVGGPTLTRFFVFHVTLLPITIIILVWFHIKLVWRTGVIAPLDMFITVDENKCKSCKKCMKSCQFGAIKFTSSKVPAINAYKCNGCRVCVKNCPAKCIAFTSKQRKLLWEPIFPHNFLHRAKACLAAFIFLIACSYFFQEIFMNVKSPANPMLTPDRIKPDWYFMASYQVLRLFPSEFLGLLVLFSACMIITFMPVIDRSGPRDLDSRPVFRFFMISGISLFVILTIWGWMI